jgi:class 3 adenylate cyclase
MEGDMPSASEERLGKLLEERLRPGADTADIDRRIRALFEEEWAVMFTDMVGFSAGTRERGIIDLLARIYAAGQVVRAAADRHAGLVIKMVGDSLLLMFRKPEAALAAAIDMQETLRARNAKLAPEDHLVLGVGIGWGPVLRLGDVDVFGEEVNYAAKLGEDSAGAYDILVTERCRGALQGYPGVKFEPRPANESAKFAHFKVEAVK